MKPKARSPLRRQGEHFVVKAEFKLNGPLRLYQAQLKVGRAVRRGAVAPNWRRAVRRSFSTAKVERPLMKTGTLSIAKCRSDGMQ